VVPPVEPSAAEPPEVVLPEETVVEVRIPGTDASGPPPRSCSATGRAPPVRRCRRIEEREGRAPLRGRGPPSVRSSTGPDPPLAAGGARIACVMRSPPALVVSAPTRRPRSIWPSSYPALVPLPPSNGPPGLSGMRQTRPTKKSKVARRARATKTGNLRPRPPVLTEPSWRCADPPRC
jgi:hypothetical protein